MEDVLLRYAVLLQARPRPLVDRGDDLHDRQASGAGEDRRLRQPFPKAAIELLRFIEQSLAVDEVEPGNFALSIGGGQRHHALRQVKREHLRLGPLLRRVGSGSGHGSSARLHPRKAPRAAAHLLAAGAGHADNLKFGGAPEGILHGDHAFRSVDAGISANHRMSGAALSVSLPSIPSTRSDVPLRNVAQRAFKASHTLLRKLEQRAHLRRAQAARRPGEGKAPAYMRVHSTLVVYSNGALDLRFLPQNPLEELRAVDARL
eukprot:scaffold53_cov193-Pinguiococcus_pyrenoidosus.AAC.46